MVELWLIEILKAIGKMFLNPLFYWAFILIVFTGYFRIKGERMDFGSKIFNLFSEWKQTWVLSIGFGIFLSLVSIGVGIVFSLETLLFISIIVILLSMTSRLNLLSASYTLGLTILLLLFLPPLLTKQSYIDPDFFGVINFPGLAILLALFLVMEGMMLRRTKRNQTFPTLTRSRRGSWVGAHHVKKMSMVPFFAVVPIGDLSPFASFWPYLSFGPEETYSLVLVPFLIGFNYKVIGTLPHLAGRKLGHQILLLSVIVLALAIATIWMPQLILVAVAIAIIGKEFINYRHRVTEQSQAPYFYDVPEGLRVLSIIPGSPADRLDVLVGETITKVNGKPINDVDAFYHALQEKGAHYRLDIVDDHGEVRFVRAAMYEGDDHELGFIFPDRPYGFREEEPKESVSS
ncbi:MAG TPA: PDZ domain-containing protein [Cerasibacillus sp.]|uniref:PDZ domain-containing protein n=1 Tax=Cerasibacillus sp. TaxID=2498711 RepID=UPI002F3E5478